MIVAVTFLVSRFSVTGIAALFADFFTQEVISFVSVSILDEIAVWSSVPIVVAGSFGVVPITAPFNNATLSMTLSKISVSSNARLYTLKLSKDPLKYASPEYMDLPR